MPRPGPRPYECVRRAWHSDRHHPIRGSLIQEIFRIVNEVHCSETKKNREWQEKLPIVVLKAEEIMYSKANSEADYSDLKTLWHRVDDAINTIIRKDDDAETGELLQPCIEAALHLGCTPRRSSRSQRNNSPKYYLRPGLSADALDPPMTLSESHPTNNPLLQFSHYMTPRSANSSHSCLNLDGRIVQNTHYTSEAYLGSPRRHTPGYDYYASARTLSSSNAWSVYPLHDNDHLPQPNDTKFHPKELSNFHSPEGVNCSGVIDPSYGHCNTCDKGCGVNCDLTLRLGSLVVPCTRNKSCCPSREDMSRSDASLNGGSKLKGCLRL